jgi:hypothetical protein
MFQYRDEHTECFKKSFTTLKAYINLYCHNVATHCKFDASGAAVPNIATASAPTVEIKMAIFTGAECAPCVFWFE